MNIEDIRPKGEPLSSEPSAGNLTALFHEIAGSVVQGGSRDLAAMPEYLPFNGASLQALYDQMREYEEAFIAHMFAEPLEPVSQVDQARLLHLWTGRVLPL